MRKIVLLFSLIISGFGVFAQPLVTPTLMGVPSTVTTSSYLFQVTDTNLSEVAIEFLIDEGGTSVRSLVIPPGGVFNYTLSGLKSNVLYSVRVRALGCAVELGCPNISTLSLPMYFKTLPLRPEPPLASLERNCPKFVGIAWKVTTRPDEITNFIVQRAYAGFGFERIATLDPSARSFYDIGMVPGGQVTYRVVAENVSGFSTSNDVSLQVQPFTAPLPPMNVSSSRLNKTDTQLNIVWENPEQEFNCGINVRSVYYVFIKLEGESEFKFYQTLYPNASNVIITGLKPNQKVEYNIFSLSDQGIMSEQRFGSDKTFGPASKPSSLIGVSYKDALGHSAIGLSWSHPPVDEDYFVIEVSTNGIDFVTLGKIKDGDNNFKHEPIQEGVGYTYRVKAGNYLYGESDYVTTDPIIYAYSAVPNAPYGLKGTASSNKIDLTWRDDSDKEDAFILERSIDNNTTFVEIAKLGRNITSYSDATVSAGKTYYYQVKASNPIGVSASSNVLMLKTLSPAGLLNNLELSYFPNPTLDFVTVDIKPNSQAENFEVSILDQNSNIVYTKTFTSPSFLLDIKGLKGGIYYLQVKASNDVAVKRIVKY